MKQKYKHWLWFIGLYIVSVLAVTSIGLFFHFLLHS